MGQISSIAGPSAKIFFTKLERHQLTLKSALTRKISFDHLYLFSRYYLYKIFLAHMDTYSSVTFKTYKTNKSYKSMFFTKIKHSCN